MPTSITIKERARMLAIDTLVHLNRATVHIDLDWHDCETQPFKCDMSERNYGTSWSLLLPERRRHETPSRFHWRWSKD